MLKHAETKNSIVQVKYKKSALCLSPKSSHHSTLPGERQNPEETKHGLTMLDVPVGTRVVQTKLYVLAQLSVHLARNPAQHLELLRGSWHRYWKQ